MIAICRKPTVRRTATDPSYPVLRMFVCTIDDDIFIICAANSGIAWSVVMDRYRVEHPDNLPTPRHLRTVPMVHLSEATGENITQQLDRLPIVQVIDSEGER